MTNARDSLMTVAPQSRLSPQPGAPASTPMVAKPPLVLRQRTCAQLAGGLSFLFIGAGVIVLVYTVMRLGMLLLFAGTWQLALGAGEELGETIDLVLGQGAVATFSCFLAFGLGHAASLLVLRVGNVHRLNLTTLLGSGIALVAWSAVAGLFVVTYFWGNGHWPWLGSPDAASQFLTVLIIGMAIVSCALVGSLSWWLAAHVLRSPAHVVA